MVDGQSDLMQQVAESSPLHTSEAFGFPVSTSDLGRSRPARGRTEPAHRGNGIASLAARPIGRPVFEGADQLSVQDLVALLLSHRAEERLDPFIAAMLQRGLPIEHIYLRSFQPAARRLGELWADDICSFVDVTLATALLQTRLRQLAPRFQRYARVDDGRRSALLATLDGDQHTFGLAMTAEFFRRSGWTVTTLSLGQGDLSSRLAGVRNLVVGFSASRPDQLPALAALVKQLRRAGRDRIAGIVVGGPLFIERPNYAEEIGADAIGLDAPHALAEAEVLVAAAEGCG